jgi:hypothetical protein
MPRVPIRIKRMASLYSYCVAGANAANGSIMITLKEGYQHRDGSKSHQFTGDFDSLRTFFKNIIRPSSSQCKVALVGFTCGICGKYVPRGSNYIVINDMSICSGNHEHL